MADIDRLSRPIVTGTPATTTQTQGSVGQATQAGGQSQFLSVLQQQLQTGRSFQFSKHAVSRVHERQIDVSETNLQRLDEGMRLAQEKGLRDALILIDQSAYIVSAANNKVITVDGEAVKGSVFTNIDGTVIV